MVYFEVHGNHYEHGQGGAGNGRHGQDGSGEREGRLVPVARSERNRRLYTEAQIREFLGIRRSGSVEPCRLVAYCRVSSAAQKPDLANQRRVLEDFVVARGLANVEFIEKIAGGLNFKRKRFLELMDAIGRREVKTLILAHRDRLTSSASSGSSIMPGSTAAN